LFKNIKFIIIYNYIKYSMCVKYTLKRDNRVFSLSFSFWCRILIFIYNQILTTSIIWWRDNPKTTSRGWDEFFAGLTPESYPSSKCFISLYSCSSQIPDKNVINFLNCFIKLQLKLKKVLKINVNFYISLLREKYNHIDSSW